VSLFQLQVCSAVLCWLLAVPPHPHSGACFERQSSVTHFISKHCTAAPLHLIFHVSLLFNSSTLQLFISSSLHLFIVSFLCCQPLNQPLILFWSLAVLSSFSRIHIAYSSPFRPYPNNPFSIPRPNNSSTHTRPTLVLHIIKHSSTHMPL